MLVLSVTALLYSVLPTQIAAQESGAASISGTITDSSGHAVQAATVTLKNHTTGLVQHSATDDQGHYSFTGLTAGSYDLTITAAGFRETGETNLRLSAGQAQSVPVQLKVGSLQQSVRVEAIAGNSIAGQHALSQNSLDTVEPKSEISSEYIKNFAPATTDYSEIINIAPGTISYNPNGVGLGQGTIYFRGFQDGDFNITWDGIPFNDSNNPTHHSWVFFPGLWVGSVDFDRSPGTASTIGQATYGGSINLLSPEVPSEQSIQPQVSYGSFNTLLLDGRYNSGMLGAHKNIGFSLDVHRMTSDGFETLNYIERNAGEIKVLYNASPNTTITGYSGVVHLFANAPNNSPYRAQINAYGWNYMMQNNDPTSAFYQSYNRNLVPTDFEYGAIRSSLKHGWLLDVTPYTYSYNNAQYYPNDNPNDTTGLATGPDSSTGWITEANCSIAANDANGVIPPCAVDKLNSYRKYGETSTISQTSKYGVFRAGMWYEWATSNRYQIPSDPLTNQDDAVPNFHENYWTNSYNPYVEYEWHATKKLTLIAGDKYAYYTLDFKQYADNGKVVGNLGGAPYTTSSGGFGSNLPSASANYRLTTNWSIYGQFGKGDEIPPTSVFDVTGGGQEVSKLPSPQTTSAYQGGTVVKLNRFTFDADYYVVKFQNNYISYAVTNPNNPAYDLNEYYLGPDSITQGFEGEINASLTHGFNLYANGTVGKATYTGTGVPSGLNVTDTPSYTQGLGLTYQGHGMDLGVIEKRVGDYYDDNGSYHNQVYVAPYNNVNLFLNYTFRKEDSIFNQSKISFSINNLWNSENITDVFPYNSPTPVGTSAYYATTTPSPLDQINLTAGRSFMVTFKMGIFPNRNK
ncbi:TonB-dependent receptor [Silvibacterium dinghuense]|uniref:TonB-dependent receptor n=1 Tax=Silvibacterium dinghuense TaxID=1560006 RepID=A0A4Q1S9A7_9BACT|nr:TonB-dependent receptor [Silvibacterium dinghuense]RXS93511.1 TonB-dependent receptor [Silvibacterium dinghuense]